MTRVQSVTKLEESFGSMFGPGNRWMVRFIGMVPVNVEDGLVGFNIVTIQGWRPFTFVNISSLRSLFMKMPVCVTLRICQVTLAVPRFAVGQAKISSLRPNVKD